MGLNGVEIWIIGKLHVFFFVFFLEFPPVEISSSQQVVLPRFLTAADKAAALLVAVLLYCTALLYMLYTTADACTAAQHCKSGSAL